MASTHLLHSQHSKHSKYSRHSTIHDQSHPKLTMIPHWLGGPIQWWIGVLEFEGGGSIQWEKWGPTLGEFLTSIHNFGTKRKISKIHFQTSISDLMISHCVVSCDGLKFVGVGQYSEWSSKSLWGSEAPAPPSPKPNPTVCQLPGQQIVSCRHWCVIDCAHNMHAWEVLRIDRR